MDPISPVFSPPVLPIWSPTPVTLDRTRRVQAEIVASLPPFWSKLHTRLKTAGSGQAKFRLLAQMAEEEEDIPDAGPYLPEPTQLDFDEEELCAWACQQSANVRGKLCQLMLGANVVPSWPLYALQYQGKSNSLWDAGMRTAAKRYVELLRKDDEVIAALRRLAQLPVPARRFLTTRMTQHASTALEIDAPATEVLDKDQDNRDADTLAQNPVRIRFYPAAFTKGAINLIVTVFHEAVHAEQMGIMHRSREAAFGNVAADLSSDEKFRGEILELSTAHLDAISGARKNDYYYYLYRYATESEREAHGAELSVALHAAACPELSQCEAGVLADIGTALAQGHKSAPKNSTDVQVRDYIERRTGFSMTTVSGLLEKTLASVHRRWSSMHGLKARGRKTLAISSPRTFARQRFETAAEQLAARVSPSRTASRRTVLNPGMTHELTDVLSRDDPCSAPSVGLVWVSLLRLQTLRDPSDQSGLLLQALISASPKLFYGPSGEARFLRLVLASALDARQASVVEVVRRHLERHFSCKLVRNPSPMQFAEAVAALQIAWYAYCSDLSRKIIFETACEVMGFASADEGATDGKPHARRQALRRAIARWPTALRPRQAGNSG